MFQFLHQCYCSDLPTSPTLKNFQNGQVNPPDILIKSFEALHADSLREVSDHNRDTNSSDQDVMYAVSTGKLKPLKHLCLGLKMKGITGNQNIIDVLNHLRHCISYHIVEEIKTDEEQSKEVSYHEEQPTRR